MRLALAVCAVLMLSACASGSSNGPAFSYSKIEVSDNSNEPIQNMIITVADMVTECGDSIALGICSERFGRRNYIQAPFIVDWTFGDKPRQTDQIEIAVPAYNPPGNPLYWAGVAKCWDARERPPGDFVELGVLI